ncbi:hypothetical protein BC941DRAFT_428271 [Chlamydoabsidia padenii]|nr:hypothetical protein BC941DRAFT_428271 [Chlamydoabsidia padenii]
MNLHPLDNNTTKKRQHSPDETIDNTNQQDTTDETTLKRRQISQDEDGDLLTRLTEILVEIKTTPSTGEISAHLLGQLRYLMLRIEELAADENNVEARQLKDESDKYLELWFEDLVAQCDADGEIDWDDLTYDQQQGSDVNNYDNGDSNNSNNDDDDDDDEEDMIALAMALQDEEDAIKKDEQDNNDDIHPLDSAMVEKTTDATSPNGQVVMNDHSSPDDDLSHINATVTQVIG